MRHQSEGQQIAHVLIVDDTPSNVTFLSEALENDVLTERRCTEPKTRVSG